MVVDELVAGLTRLVVEVSQVRQVDRVGAPQQATPPVRGPGTGALGREGDITGRYDGRASVGEVWLIDWPNTDRQSFSQSPHQPTPWGRFGN